MTADMAFFLCILEAHESEDLNGAQASIVHRSRQREHQGSTKPRLRTLCKSTNKGKCTVFAWLLQKLCDNDRRKKMFTME